MGRLHVDEMLEELSPEEFDELYAANVLDPLDDSWKQTSLLAAVIVNKLESIACRMSGKKVSESSFVEADAFIPALDKKPKQRRQQTAEEMLAVWQSSVRSR